MTLGVGWRYALVSGGLMVAVSSFHSVGAPASPNRLTGGRTGDGGRVEGRCSHRGRRLARPEDGKARGMMRSGVGRERGDVLKRHRGGNFQSFRRFGPGAA